MSKSNLETLMSALEVLANLRSDGHYTIFKFTTGWKVMLATLNLDAGKQGELVRKMKLYSTLEEAIEGLLRANFGEV